MVDPSSGQQSGALGSGPSGHVRESQVAASTFGLLRARHSESAGRQFRPAPPQSGRRRLQLGSGSLRFVGVGLYEPKRGLALRTGQPPVGFVSAARIQRLRPALGRLRPRPQQANERARVDAVRRPRPAAGNVRGRPRRPPPVLASARRPSVVRLVGLHVRIAVRQRSGRTVVGLWRRPRPARPLVQQQHVRPAFRHRLLDAVDR